jgi:hypothetical protein
MNSDLTNKGKILFITANKCKSAIRNLKSQIESLQYSKNS